MSYFSAPPAPTTELGRYRVLSPKAGVRVSPLQLGGMSIGEKWHTRGFGSMDKQSSFNLLNAYFDNGGNFIDTANLYQAESSEEFIGEWAESRGIRDQLFLATKYTTNYKTEDSSIAQKVMFMGNNIKSMHVSLHASLKKLRTDYIDLFYVHSWDWDTSVEEMMQGLNILVKQGKVLYLGISDTPAWIVSKANQYARDHGLAQFVIYQGMWNVIQRSFEREFLPMVRSEGMAVAPFAVLSGGKIRTDAEEERRRQSGEKGRTAFDPNWERTPAEKKVTDALEKVAAEVGAKNIQAVAIAYLMQKTPYVFPIIGGRKVEQLLDNMEALKVHLTAEHIQAIDGVSPLAPEFPYFIIGDGSTVSPLMAYDAPVVDCPKAEAIRPASSIVSV